MQGHRSGAVGERRSSRLPKHDYTSSLMYFVTVCACNMECVFGSVGSDGKVTLSEWGHVVEACWLAIPEHFPGSALDQWVTMPNHLHGIVATEALTVNARGDACVAPTNVPALRCPWPGPPVAWRDCRIVQVGCDEADSRDGRETRRDRLATQLPRAHHSRQRRLTASPSIHREQSDSLGREVPRVALTASSPPTNASSKTNTPARRRE